MIKTCTITSKFESFKSLQNRENVFHIEDYIQISSLSEAREMTDDIYYQNNDFISEHEYKGYKITWSWYSDIFQFCINYLEIKSLIQVIDEQNFQNIKIEDISPQYSKVLKIFFFNTNVISNPPKNLLFNNIKQIFFNALVLLYSLISMVFLILRPGLSIGTYTGDFVYKSTKSDFRLNHLYEKYAENKVQYIEFIRITKINNFFFNIFKRKRFAIYYTSIIFFIDLFFNKKKYHKQPKNFYESIIYRYHNTNLVFNKSTSIIEILLKVLRIKSFVLISFSSRSAHLAIAAKSLGIKTIGIMHGLQQKDDSVYEFMESYSERKKIGCDIYGVWSLHYLQYYKRYCKIIDSENIEYSGLLRPLSNNFKSIKPFQRISITSIKVLVISEVHVSVSEIIPFLKSLLKHDDIEASIKVRPMIKDSYYEDMKVVFPLSNNFKVFDGKIEDVANEFDVFIGSNSSAVIEASLFGKISILLNTKKFGDYFEMDSLISGHSLLINEPENLYQHIVDRVNNEDTLETAIKIRTKFFGGNKDGAQWVVEQL